MPPRRVLSFEAAAPLLLGMSMTPSTTAWATWTPRGPNSRASDCASARRANIPAANPPNCADPRTDAVAPVAISVGGWGVPPAEEVVLVVGGAGGGGPPLSTRARGGRPKPPARTASSTSRRGRRAPSRPSLRRPWARCRTFKRQRRQRWEERAVLVLLN